jgi:hypothetical protein
MICPWLRGSLPPEYSLLFFLCTQEEDGWAMELLAVTCLSLAAKMEETLVPSLLDLQAITHHSNNLQRMLVILRDDRLSE